MCGIAGSFNSSMFEILMQANAERGDFAAGVLQIKKKHGHETYKKKGGKIDFDRDLILDDENKYYIGHVQAPTSGNRKWGYETTHPFFSLNWAIIHNGVLTNEDQLRKKDLPWDENPVDSSLIVNLLEKNTKEGTLSIQQQYEVICKALKKLKGTFALAILYLPTNALYIVRQGSVLHFDKKGNFSTIPGDTFEPVPEGVVFKLKGKNWTEVGKFKQKSPFLFV